MSTDEKATDALNKIRALRALTVQTGTRTTRSQNEILQSLPTEVLAVVAVQLQRDSK